MLDHPASITKQIKQDPFEYLSQQGYKSIAGIDEVGRGCLAGPVVAAAVILPYPFTLGGVRDSKKLTDKARRYLTEKIKIIAISYSIGEVSAKEIDRIGIQQASILAMEQAVKGLNKTPDYLLIDGRMKLSINLPQQWIIRGDDISKPISAASIIAKVYRDDLMINLDPQYPKYKFSQHKGYGTELHRKVIRNHGPTILHRKSFARVKEYV